METVKDVYCSLQMPSEHQENDSISTLQLISGSLFEIEWSAEDIYKL